MEKKKLGQVRDGCGLLIYYFYFILWILLFPGEVTQAALVET